jgi:hypothetical protein
MNSLRSVPFSSTTDSRGFTYLGKLELHHWRASARPTARQDNLPPLPNDAMNEATATKKRKSDEAAASNHPKRPRLEVTEAYVNSQRNDIGGRIQSQGGSMHLANTYNTGGGDVHFNSMCLDAFKRNDTLDLFCKLIFGA